MELERSTIPEKTPPSKRASLPGVSPPTVRIHSTVGLKSPSNESSASSEGAMLTDDEFLKLMSEMQELTSMPAAIKPPSLPLAATEPEAPPTPIVENGDVHEREQYQVAGSGKEVRDTVVEGSQGESRQMIVIINETVKLFEPQMFTLFF